MKKHSEIVEHLKKVNPYPEDIFIYAKPNLWNFIFHKDRVMGSWGRVVWLLCITELLDQFLKE